MTDLSMESLFVMGNTNVKEIVNPTIFALEIHTFLFVKLLVLIVWKWRPGPQAAER